MFNEVDDVCLTGVEPAILTWHDQIKTISDKNEETRISAFLQFSVLTKNSKKNFADVRKKCFSSLQWRDGRL